MSTRDVTSLDLECTYHKSRVASMSLKVLLSIDVTSN